MQLRPYQEEFVDAVRHDFEQGHRRVMGVGATGMGKTIVTSDLMKREQGNCLFLADAQELVQQNARKFTEYSGEPCGVEMAEEAAIPGIDRVVVATSQSLFRRLDKYPEDYFNLIVVDECHRNSMGDMAQAVFKHFSSYANILGVTATPFRSDRKKLGDFFEKISIEIGLARLIREGYLSRITIKSVPMKVDLSQINRKGADYAVEDLGAVIEPILTEAATQLVDHAEDRKKIVIFLPLVKTSIRMTRILNDMGVKAVHVSGDDKSAMRQFTHGDARVICNAQLLTTGWDCPEVDCVMVLRPTKSLSLYCQMVGRGTRISDGKDDLLLLDPLFLTDDHKLITPARLTASSQEQADAMMEKVQEETGESVDLLELDKDIEEQRAEALRTRMKQKERKKMRLVDAVEFSLNCDDLETAEFEPEFGWEQEPPSEQQMAALDRAGIESHDIATRGQAAKVLDLIATRRRKGLATPKQLRLLKRFNHPNPANATFGEAGQFIDAAIGKKKKPPLPPSLLAEMRALGIDPKKHPTEKSARDAIENWKPF